MRLGFRRDGRSGKRELVLRPGRMETANASRLLWLKANERDVLLSLLRQEGRDPAKPKLYYDVDGYVSLRSFVKKLPLSVPVMGAMFASVIEVVSWCAVEGVGYSGVLFDGRYVFVDSASSLHFAFVPYDGMAYRAGNSPLRLLRLLCDVKRLSFESPDALTLCERLGDFVLGEDGVFSLNRFREFVKAETGVVVLPDGTTVGTGEDVADTAASPREPQAQVISKAKSRGPNAFDSFAGPLPDAPYVLCDISRGAVYGLRAGVTTIGRGSFCDARPDGHPRLSRAHASVRISHAGIALCDMGSSNGTFVDGVRLRPYEEMRIEIGQSFLLGGDEFRVEKTEGM